MGKIRSKDTSPEILVRRLTHRLGYRFRLHRKDLPGKPDLTFISKRKAIFVHGCFWHQHQAPSCKIARLPKSNKDYWIPKLKRNVERDFLHRKSFKKMGWDSLVIWECETNKPERLGKRIEEFLATKSA